MATAEIELAPLNYKVSTSQNEPNNQHGLSIFKAWLFIVGEMAGIGALIYSMVIFDIITSSLVLLMIGGIAMFSGLKLSETWTCLTRDPELRHRTEGCKEPYPLMTEVAFGKRGRDLSRFCVMITLTMVTCIDLILTSSMVKQLAEGFGWSGLCPCDIMIWLMIILTPATFLPTPKDQWGIAVVAAFSTVLAFCFTAVQALYYEKGKYDFEFVNGLGYEMEGANASEPIKLPYPAKDSIEYTSYNASSLGETDERLTVVKAFFDVPFIGVATSEQLVKLILFYIFGFGGMSIFPTIQTDMKRSGDFNKVVIYSITTLLALYLLVMIPGYLSFPYPNSNIITSLTEDAAMTILANLLITGHLVAAMIILTNPPMQQIEQLIFKDREAGKIKIYLLRSCFMLGILVFCHTVPSFGPLVSFIGSTTVMLNSFLLPSLLYLKIVHKVNFWQVGQVWKKVPKLDCLIIALVMVTGVYGSTCGLYYLFSDLISSDKKVLVPPCWYDREAACSSFGSSKH